MSVKFIIYGTHQRDSIINKNAAILGLSSSDIIYDDRPNGGEAYYVTQKAWRSQINCGAEWVCGLQDDVLLCDNFKSIIEQICDRMDKIKHECIVSLFDFQYKSSPLSDFTKNESPYYYTNMISGQGILMHTAIIQKVFDGIDEKYKDSINTIMDDGAITDYCAYNVTAKVTTVPPTLQHIGDISTIDHKRPIRRSRNYVQNPQVDGSNLSTNDEVFQDMIKEGWAKKRNV